jgi:hypothetical protein|tara:strand:+ start:934 stop:1107 length:174 start_codon:yes stop_codon:yes gene_type:complete
LSLALKRSDVPPHPRLKDRIHENPINTVKYYGRLKVRNPSKDCFEELDREVFHEVLG